MSRAGPTCSLATGFVWRKSAGGSASMLFIKGRPSIRVSRTSCRIRVHGGGGCRVGL